MLLLHTTVLYVPHCAFEAFVTVHRGEISYVHIILAAPTVVPQCLSSFFSLRFALIILQRLGVETRCLSLSFSVYSIPPSPFLPSLRRKRDRISENIRM